MRVSSAARLLTLTVLVSATTLAACGSDAPSQAATAEPGDAFCVLAEKARDLGDAIDTSGTDPAETKDQVEAALAASKAAAKKAPKDFEELAAKTVDQQEKTVELLEKYDYSFIDAFTSDEGAALFTDEGFKQNQDDRDAYLDDKCEIAPTENSGGPTFASGDEGIRQLFKLFALGTGTEVTDDQLDCLVGELSGVLTDDDMAAISNGTGTPEANTAIGQAAVTCGLDLSNVGS